MFTDFMSRLSLRSSCIEEISFFINALDIPRTALDVGSLRSRYKAFLKIYTLTLVSFKRPRTYAKMSPNYWNHWWNITHIGDLKLRLNRFLTMTSLANEVAESPQTINYLHILTISIFRERHSIRKIVIARTMDHSKFIWICNSKIFFSPIRYD